MTTADPYPMLPQGQQPRRLSSRRASAAQDPFGRLTLTSATQAESVSRLTIVRVPQSAVSDDGSAPSRPGSALGSRPGSAASNYRDGGRELGRSGSERRHERERSGDSRDSDGRVRRSSWGSASGEGGGQGGRGRMSFAFSSFTPIHPPASSAPERERGPSSGGTPTSPYPGTSPGSGPGFAGTFGHSRTRTQSTTSSSAPTRPTTQTLTPQQTVDLALSLATPAATQEEEYETPTIAELGEQDYLPFLDRCAEVQQLITAPGPTCDLFKLLRQTFPAPSPNSAASRSSEPALPLPQDPTHWTYPQLLHHLTSIPRSQCQDREWTRLARLCIRAHSEALWERVKAALGIPPELEVEDVRDDPSQAWELYDFGRAGEADADPALLFGQEDVDNEDPEGELLFSQTEGGLGLEPVGGRLEPVYQGDASPLLSPTLGAALSPSLGATHSPNLGQPSLGALSSSISGMGMPDLAELREEDEEEEAEEGGDGDGGASDKASAASRSRSRSSSIGSTRSTASHASRQIHGLRITTASGPSSVAATPPMLTPGGNNVLASNAGLTRAFSTGSIRAGLARLKMTPMTPPSPATGGGTGSTTPGTTTAGAEGGRYARPSVTITASSQDNLPAGSGGGRPRGATVNVASLASGRSGSPGTTLARERESLQAQQGGQPTGSAALEGSALSPSSPSTSPQSPVRRRISSGAGTAVGGVGGGMYHPLAERGPGNPLFPSSFSRLSASPTLSANNPALRRSLDQPAPGGPPLPYNARRKHARVPSWAEGMLEGRNSGEFEYAVTVASGSSVYGD